MKVKYCPCCRTENCRIVQVREHYYSIECSVCNSITNIWIQTPERAFILPDMIEGHSAL